MMGTFQSFVIVSSQTDSQIVHRGRFETTEPYASDGKSSGIRVAPICRIGAHWNVRIKGVC